MRKGTMIGRAVEESKEVVEGCEEAQVHRQKWETNAVNTVFNEVGEVEEGEEAVDVWKRHFENVMNSEGVVAEE